MRLARPILTLLLLLAMLPWGAYAGGRAPSIPDRAVAALAADLEGMAADIVPDRDGKQAAVSAKSKRCRGPALPGASCGPDLFVPGGSAAGAPSSLSSLAHAATPPLPDGLAPSGPLDPPRSS